MHVHGAVPLQDPYVASSTQLNPPLQHPYDGEQAWPAPAQVDAWQVRPLVPGRLTQARPEQQSPEAVQDSPVPRQIAGCSQTPLLQISEQHSPEVAQVEPLALQGIRQKLPNSSPRHCAGAQQLETPGVHAELSDKQVGPASGGVPASEPASGVPESGVPASGVPASIVPASGGGGGGGGGGCGRLQMPLTHEPEQQATPPMVHAEPSGMHVLCAMQRRYPY
jgi:hypothetical protein